MRNLTHVGPSLSWWVFGGSVVVAAGLVAGALAVHTLAVATSPPCESDIDELCDAPPRDDHLGHAPPRDDHLSHACGRGHGHVAPAAQALDPEQLAGLWTRWEDPTLGAPVRFWYFHPDGQGLLRYGRIGLVTTQSFAYAIEGDGLEIRFRKSGREVTSALTLERDDQGRPCFRFASRAGLEADGGRFCRVRGPLTAAHGEVGADGWRAATSDDAISDALWMDQRHFVTGGSEFALYQLASGAVDGRGVGWFHRGDFDDWSTESLTYRLRGNSLELCFGLRGDCTTTAVSIRDGDPRELRLREDPRDYWAPHGYRYVGRSFGQSAQPDVTVHAPTEPSASVAWTAIVGLAPIDGAHATAPNGSQGPALAPPGPAL